MKKSTQMRALLMSGLAMLLTVSMLVGTTFAWFTDSVESGRNQIVAGNLDVELYNAIGKDASKKVTANTALFEEVELWEPGAVVYENFTVANEGDLTLKYQLGVIVANAQGEKNLADVLKVAVVADGIEATDRDALISSIAADAWMDFESFAKTGTLAADGIATYGIVIWWEPSDIDNDYNMNNNKGEALSIEIGVSLFATQASAEEDSFGADYDKDAMIFVSNTAEAQAALDEAAPGAIIKLAPGNYGTLYLRPYAGGAATKTVDWIGNNYGWETYTLFEDITIVGAEGAVVDAIEIEGGTYYYTEHSQDDTYPVMLSLVELKNVVFDGVTFTGNGGYDPQGHGNVINLSGHNIKIDGLTLKNCVLENDENNARLIYKTEGTTYVHTYAYDGETYTFSPTLKNITVTGCTFNGGYMGLELRETENLTITNNIFNVADRNMLLPVNTGCTYSGTITITGNVSNNAQERFVRADGMGDAVVVIKDNTIVNYMGADADYIKVTGANNVTIENNTITYGAKDNATFANALKIASDGSTITLLSGGDYSLLAIPKNASAKNITVKAEEGVKVGAVYQIGCGYCTGGILAMPENLTFDGITFDGQIGELANGNFCTCTHAITDIGGLSGFLTRWSKANGLTFKDCEFVNGAAISLSYGGSKNLVVDGCTFKDTVSSAVSAYSTNGVTVTGCTMENIGFAAIFAGDESQNIVFENNTVTSTGSRIIRLNKLTTGTTVTVKGNTFGVANTDLAEAADNNGQIVKISASVSAIVTFEDNTYNGAAFPEVTTTDNANWFAVAN